MSDLPDAILHLAADGSILAAADGALGRPAGALVGRPAAELLGPLPALGAPFTFSHAGVRGRGLPGPGGTCWIVLEPDALEETERVRMERRLRDAEQPFRALFETISCGVAVLDGDMRALEVNKEWARILGYEPAQLVGHLLSEFIVEDEVAAHEARRDLLRAGPGDGIQRRRVRHRSGAVAQVEGTATPFLQDGQPRFLAVIFDVTALREAEDARHASDERFRLAFESAPIGIGIFEPDGRVRTVNRAYAQMLGRPAETLVGVPLRELVAPEDLPTLEARIARHKAGGGPLPNHRYRLLGHEGRHVWIEGGSAALRDSAGRVTGYVTHGVELTEHLRLEEQVRRAQRAETIGRIAGGVAHDFNNTLGIIRGSVELLQRRAHDTATEMKVLERIDAAAQRAAELTRQLTILGRRDFTTSGNSDPADVIADLRPVIAGALGEGIALQVRLAENTPEVRMARPHLEQLLLNLTMNAREAMPDGGVFLVAARPVTLRGDEPRAGGLQGNFVAWEVADDGVGMPPSVAAVAFEPFFTTKALGKGSGLGLAIVQSLVTQAGGHIDLQTGPGVGTNFLFHLPAEGAATPEPVTPGEPTAAPAASTASSHGGQTLLLCEDEPDLLDLFVHVLRESGYRVHATSDPQEAIRLADAHRIDALITDVVMPTMRGTVLAAEIRRRHPGAPVLFVSGYSEERIGAAADPSQGAFLAKPFLPSALVKAVGVMLR